MGKLKEQIVTPIQEQAENLGFSTIHDAIDAGYMVKFPNGDYGDPRLILESELEQEIAHKEWVKEKNQVIKELQYARDYIVTLVGKRTPQTEYITHAIQFIERGEV